MTNLRKYSVRFALLGLLVAAAAMAAPSAFARSHWSVGINVGGPGYGVGYYGGRHGYGYGYVGGGYYPAYYPSYYAAPVYYDYGPSYYPAYYPSYGSVYYSSGGYRHGGHYYRGGHGHNYYRGDYGHRSGYYNRGR